MIKHGQKKQQPGFTMRCKALVSLEPGAPTPRSSRRQLACRDYFGMDGWMPKIFNVSDYGSEFFVF